MKRLLAEDKLKHVVVSAIIAVVLNLILPWWVAGLLTLAIGVGKEVYDKLSGKGHAEWEDLVADVVGSGVGLSIGLLTSCKPVEKVVYVPKVHNVTTTIYAHDTVVVVKVPETYAERVTTDTVSELSTPFAYSRAEVSGGKLSHSLGTHGELPTSVRIEEKIITIRDSIPYPVEVEVIREVAKPLRWWHKALMWIGVAAILSVAGYIGIKALGR
jgi:hypothetical protein